MGEVTAGDARDADAGLRVEPAVRVVEPDPSWPARFVELADHVRSALGDPSLQVDHIGSTAVPGLVAKNVIDLQVTVTSLAVADGWPDAIGPFRRRADRAADHVPPGARPGADWHKRYWSAEAPRAHLHVREAGRANQRYALLFRDHLRAHPLAAEAYGRAKRTLATRCSSSADYADAKDPICDLIMVAAEDWAARSGWTAGHQQTGPASS